MPRIGEHRIGALFPCQPLKTGQTVQYSGKEDDGYWEKGISKDYVVLTVAQYSGTVDIVLNAKTHALSNNCVFDEKTGLMWSRYAPDGDIGPGNDGKLLWLDDVNNEDIFDFKDQANVKGLGGYDDWRVPNVNELASLIIWGGASPYIDHIAFPDAPDTGYIWTSTTDPTTTTNAVYATVFDPGVWAGVSKTTTQAFCYLVRGPK